VKIGAYLGLLVLGTAAALPAGSIVSNGSYDTVTMRDVGLPKAGVFSVEDAFRAPLQDGLADNGYLPVNAPDPIFSPKPKFPVGDLTLDPATRLRVLRELGLAGVPEPSTLGLAAFALGMLGLKLKGRRH
jgi:hypothetical protein